VQLLLVEEEVEMREPPNSYFFLQVHGIICLLKSFVSRFCTPDMVSMDFSAYFHHMNSRWAPKEIRTSSWWPTLHMRVRCMMTGLLLTWVRHLMWQCSNPRTPEPSTNTTSSADFFSCESVMHIENMTFS